MVSCSSNLGKCLSTFWLTFGSDNILNFCRISEYRNENSFCHFFFCWDWLNLLFFYMIWGIYLKLVWIYPEDTCPVSRWHQLSSCFHERQGKRSNNFIAFSTGFHFFLPWNTSVMPSENLGSRGKTRSICV